MSDLSALFSALPVGNEPVLTGLPRGVGQPVPEGNLAPPTSKWETFAKLAIPAALSIIAGRMGGPESVGALLQGQAQGMERQRVQGLQGRQIAATEELRRTQMAREERMAAAEEQQAAAQTAAARQRSIQAMFKEVETALSVEGLARMTPEQRTSIMDKYQLLAELQGLPGKDLRTLWDARIPSAEEKRGAAIAGIASNPEFIKAIKDPTRRGPALDGIWHDVKHPDIPVRGSDVLAWQPIPPESDFEPILVPGSSEDAEGNVQTWSTVLDKKALKPGQVVGRGGKKAKPPATPAKDYDDVEEFPIKDSQGRKTGVEKVYLKGGKVVRREIVKAGAAGATAAPPSSSRVDRIPGLR